ncbi:MAG: Rpn family recombination-promoting nuclease/putative transposase [Lachnospiraceae bacterium]|nr:Rpn family recombination-promoting nuclease/putative transposase [Lachnospiraceae bacterium]
MGQKDITEKMLADYNDVFADIVNVLLFHGEQVIGEYSLENVKDKSQYKVDGKIHEEERDVSKVVNGQKVRIALIGFEHQTDVDKDEPIRVIGYDGASYRAQLLNDRKERYPVVTLVLYFGTTPWTGPKTLYEAVNVPDEWKPYVNDYKINLFEIAFLNPEQVQLFTSSFKIVADYFVQMRMNKTYVATRETFTHADELLKLMSVLTNDSRFEEAQQQAKLCGKGGMTNMCEVLDRVEAKGRAEGIRKSLQASKLLRKGICTCVEELVSQGIEEDIAMEVYADFMSEQ